MRNPTALALGSLMAAALLGAAWLAVTRQGIATSSHAAVPPRADRGAAVMAARGCLPAGSPAGEEQSLLREGQLRQDLGSDDPQTRDRALRHGLRKWARTDPRSAARFALEISDESLREQALRLVAQTWGARDAEDAVEWAMSLSAGTLRREMLSAVCLGLSTRDPARGVQLAQGLSFHDDSLLENLTTQWAAKDGGAASSWVFQQPSGAERDRLMARVAFAEAQESPAEAARLVIEQIPNGDTQTEAIISVVNRWGQRDLAGASAWVASFPPGSLRDRAQGELPRDLALH